MDLNNFIQSGTLELYVLGMANANEIALTEACLQAYPSEINAEIYEINEALAFEALQYEATPPPALKNSIEEAIFGEAIINAPAQAITKPINNQTNNTPLFISKKSNNIYKYGAVAGIALLLGSLVTNYMLYSKINATNNDVAALQNKYNDLTNKDLENTQALKVVTNDNAKAVSLKGQKIAPSATAKIYWLANTGEVYIDPSNLPAVSNSEQYQLWAIVDGKPIDAGMIMKDSKTGKMQKMKNFEKAQAFAITLEAVGGSKTPTLEKMYVMAAL